CDARVPHEGHRGHEGGRGTREGARRLEPVAHRDGARAAHRLREGGCAREARARGAPAAHRRRPRGERPAARRPRADPRPIADDEGRCPELSRTLRIAGEIVLALAGITFTAQGLGLTHGVRSVMNDRPEWVAIGSGLVVLAMVLLWQTTRRRPA